MKKILILILFLTTFGSRLSIHFPEIVNVIESCTWVLVVLALIKQTNDNRWVIGFALFATDFFRDIIILFNPHEPYYKIISITCTLIVLLGAYITAPKKWSY